MKEIAIQTPERVTLIDITEKVRAAVEETGIEDGICVVFSPHTTCGITVNENADPDVRADMIKSLADIVRDVGFAHAEGNSDSHVKTSLFGESSLFIVEGGQMKLGTWQGIYLAEFDGPRTRKVWVKEVAQ